jgi:pimeloyl-ACP methyl ester carboxylesterase
LSWFALLLLGGCASPAQRLDGQAAKLGFIKQTIPGTICPHIVYLNGAWGQAGVLHIYLEGDGTPWINRFMVASDPTPRNPLVLRLMAQDENPALYLARPCYNGQFDASTCSPLLWTSRRYAPEIVDSMAAALHHMLANSSYKNLVFIGYSGGGTLAMLLAERFAETSAILTVSGNLDVERWTVLHHYSPLSGSLNPATRPPLADHIVQLHFAGGRDQNIPARLIKPVIDRQHYAKLMDIDSYDHTCCWELGWSTILDQLVSSMLTSPVIN